MQHNEKSSNHQDLKLPHRDVHLSRSISNIQLVYNKYLLDMPAGGRVE